MAGLLVEADGDGVTDAWDAAGELPDGPLGLVRFPFPIAHSVGHSFNNSSLNSLQPRIKLLTCINNAYPSASVMSLDKNTYFV